MEATVMQKFSGTVIRKNDKMLVVEVVTYKTHPKYLKKYRSSKKYHVHTDSNVQNVGDTVSFVGCRPMSRTKKFKVVE
jgi:small subunit ribosomal protein S17